MFITFSPVRSDVPLSLACEGDVLILNGERFDFSPLEEGAELPPEAIDSDWFCGPVRREAGELTLRLALPHGPEAPQETLYPAAMRIDRSGPVTLPPHDHVPGDADNG